MTELLQTGIYDVVMSGIAMTPDRLDEMAFSDPYLDATVALIVEDFRKDEFDTIEKVRTLEKLQIAIVARDRNLRERLKELYPNAEIVMLDSPIDFFEKNFPNLDAMLSTAEGGSAWTLLYPKFHAVVVKPETHKIPFAYPIAQGDQVLANIINKWIYLEKDSPSYNRKFDYWIMGVGAEAKKPRWSVARDVLGWWPDEEEKKKAIPTDENKE
jgi:ABC-type amino acid transport substrate-binding protein